MPDLDGIVATREITAAMPSARVLILTTFEDDDYIFGGLAAGASGFLLKRTQPEQLIDAIHTVAAGEALLSPSVTRTVIRHMAAQPPPHPPAGPLLERLTPRERDVLELVARGLSNTEIAADARGRGIDRQDPREAGPRQAGAARPRPGRHPRLRDRPGRPPVRSTPSAFGRDGNNGRMNERS